jgi:hypothetical protein
MILELMKRDLAWKAGLAQVPVATVLLLVDPGDPDPLWTRLLTLHTLLIVSGFMCPPARATLFESALPIAGRHIFLARLFSRLAMVWLPVLTAIFVILVGRDASWAEVLGMLQCGTLFTLAYLLPLAVRARECAAPTGLVIAVWAGVAAGGALAWHFLPPAIFLPVFLLGGALILLRTWLVIPASFQVAPILAVGSVASPKSTQEARTLVWWPVLRSAGFGRPLVLLPVGMFCGWVPADSWSLVGMCVILGNDLVRQRTRWLYALPLSFRALSLITLVPSLALLLGGVAIGRYFYKPLGWDYSVSGGPRRQPPTDMDIPVNFEFWHRAPAGPAPVIRSPWGETVDATTVRVLKATFFNPYSVGPQNSKRFFDWQFGRATEAVYGRVIPIEQYAPSWRYGGFEPVTARPRMRILTLSADLLAMLLVVYLTEWTRWHRLRRLSGLVPGALLGPWFMFVVVMLLGPASMFVGVAIERFYSFPLGTALGHAALLHLSSLLPNNLLAVTAASMLPVIGMWWLIEKQFSKSEVRGPMGPPGEWGRRMQAE